MDVAAALTRTLLQLTVGIVTGVMEEEIALLQEQPQPQQRQRPGSEKLLLTAAGRGRHGKAPLGRKLAFGMGRRLHCVLANGMHLGPDYCGYWEGILAPYWQRLL
jgi:hypothetical protein